PLPRRPAGLPGGVRALGPGGREHDNRHRGRGQPQIAVPRALLAGDLPGHHVEADLLPAGLRARDRLPPVPALPDRCPAAAVAGPVVGPLAGAAAVGLLATRGRRVLFRRRRVGRDARHFDIYKFRTMTRGAESRGAGLWGSSDDPRITRLGRLLRSTSIDELPQVLNVVRGEMTLVGPRPKPREIVDR